jgi:hypothetical protein
LSLCLDSIVVDRFIDFISQQYNVVSLTFDSVNKAFFIAVYSIYSDKSNNISPLYLKQKISAEEVVANNLQERLIVLKNLFEAVDILLLIDLLIL